MATLPEIKKNREEKLRKIIHSGLNPYPQKTKRTHTIREVLEDFSKLAEKIQEVVVVGRIRTLRGHGGATFFDIEDGSGKIQALLRKNKIGEKGYQFFQELVDIGDFLEVRGTLMKTKTNEKTVEASDFNFLAKSLLPLPEKWHGLKDVEERYRKRYLDLLFSKEVRKKFELRAQIIKNLREFLENEGFLEVETPILQPIYGGAEAKPFRTHLNALDIDLYLRIATELYLKKLLVGGFEKVYEIGKCFRNEGIDKFHNPDFTMLEFYWAYADHNDMMKFIEKMFEFLLKKIFGKLEIEYEGKKVNFKLPWKRAEYFELFQKETGLDLEELSKEGLAREAKKLGVKIEKGAQKPQIADKIFKKLCQPKIQQPTFVLHYPAGAFPLSKTFEKNPKKLACFQGFAAGWEIIKVFSELNDPQEQRKRFEEQEKLHKKGLEEAQRMDEDFLTALEYGMPPAAGFGMGIDRLAALLTDSHSLREVILFPIMRPKK